MTTTAAYAKASFTIPRDEIKNNLIIEVYDRVENTIVSETFSLLGMHHSSNIALEMGLRFPHDGVYEVIKRAEGVDGSEQRCVLVVENLNN
jgi:hypothetical protein